MRKHILVDHTWRTARWRRRRRTRANPGAPVSPRWPPAPQRAPDPQRPPPAAASSSHPRAPPCAYPSPAPRAPRRRPRPTPRTSTTVPAPAPHLRGTGIFHWELKAMTARARRRRPVTRRCGMGRNQGRWSSSMLQSVDAAARDGLGKENRARVEREAKVYMWCLVDLGRQFNRTVQDELGLSNVTRSLAVATIHATYRKKRPGHHREIGDYSFSCCWQSSNGHLGLVYFQIFLQNRNSSTFVCIWQILSNYGLTRLKRFVSSIPTKLCN